MRNSEGGVAGESENPSLVGRQRRWGVDALLGLVIEVLGWAVVVAAVAFAFGLWEATPPVGERLGDDPEPLRGLGLLCAGLMSAGFGRLAGVAGRAGSGCAGKVGATLFEVVCWCAAAFYSVTSLQWWQSSSLVVHRVERTQVGLDVLDVLVSVLFAAATILLGRVLRILGTADRP